MDYELPERIESGDGTYKVTGGGMRGGLIIGGSDVILTYRSRKQEGEAVVAEIAAVGRKTSRGAPSSTRASRTSSPRRPRLGESSSSLSCAPSKGAGSTRSDWKHPAGFFYELPRGE